LRLRVLAVGADKSGLFEPAAAEYLKRLGRYVPSEVVEVPPSKKGGSDPLRARDEEGDALLARVKPADTVVALDERGEELSSEELSRKVVQEAMVRGKDLVFLIGGAEGLSAAVRARANRVLSLSRMTLPHRLARVVLLEQLYRALAIARGEPYHK
jgi:23S rRNA (pseudouridine1915-N3)-methyltransferase